MSNTPTPQAGQSWPKAYFQPGNILLVVEHLNANLLAVNDLISGIQQSLIALREENLSNALINSERVLTFKHEANAFECHDFRQPTDNALFFSWVFLEPRPQ